MRVRREIAIYQKKNDKYIESIEIDLSVDELINILDVDMDEDPGVYMVYKISKEQYNQIKKIIPNLKEIDFNMLELFYECFQVD